MFMASVFVFSASGKLRGDNRDIQAIVGLHLPYPSLLARIVGGGEIIGALMLTLGVATQLAALLLGIFLFFVTLAFLPFWKIADDEAHFGAENAFFGNFGLMGGLAFIFVFGPGTYALVPMAWPL
jgi:putative oxidoreductase